MAKTWIASPDGNVSRGSRALPFRTENTPADTGVPPEMAHSW
jgi:hypothetical protein